MSSREDQRAVDPALLAQVRQDAHRRRQDKYRQRRRQDHRSINPHHHAAIDIAKNLTPPPPHQQTHHETYRDRAAERRRKDTHVREDTAEEYARAVGARGSGDEIDEDDDEDDGAQETKGLDFEALRKRREQIAGDEAKRLEKERDRCEMAKDLVAACRKYPLLKRRSFQGKEEKKAMERFVKGKVRLVYGGEHELPKMVMGEAMKVDTVVVRGPGEKGLAKLEAALGRIAERSSSKGEEKGVGVIGDGEDEDIFDDVEGEYSLDVSAIMEKKRAEQAEALAAQQAKEEVRPSLPASTDDFEGYAQVEEYPEATSEHGVGPMMPPEGLSYEQYPDAFDQDKETTKEESEIQGPVMPQFQAGYEGYPEADEVNENAKEEGDFQGPSMPQFHGGYDGYPEVDEGEVPDIAKPIGSNNESYLETPESS